MPLTGCAYYPEHWDESRWAQDARLMKDAGLQVVRLAEFAWDKMEPEEGEYNWVWLDKAIQVLAAEGLKIVLCTPTPTPPPWLTHKHPDILRVEQNGVRVSPGSRRLVTANAPAYQDYSRGIVEAITQRYGKLSDVIGWQVDNEFGCGETTRSHGAHDQRAFQTWLQAKYGTLDELNTAWGTQFWGMTYYDWAHIPIPGITTEPQNPSMRLDFRRFSSDAWVQFQKMQIDIIRKNSPGRFITHNFMIRHWSLDYWELARDLDFVSYDNYIHGLRNPAEVSMNLDLMWSLKRQNFWVMEQQTGRVNWHPHNPPVPPQQIALWSHQAVAHGAEAIIYFRYRATRFGTEQRHAGLLRQDGTLDHAYHEAQQVSEQFQQLPAGMQRPPAKVAIAFDYSDLWSIEIEPHNQDFWYWDVAYELYKHYWDGNQPVDFIHRDFDPNGSPYETIILPCAILQHSGDVERYRRWVEAGGKLILTFRTGQREAGNLTVGESMPAGWAALMGATVIDYYSAPPTTPPADTRFWYDPAHHPGETIHAADGTTVQYKLWAETLQPTAAHTLHHYADGMLKDQAAITVNQLGAGSVTYVGCWLVDWSPILGTLAPTISKSYPLTFADGSHYTLHYNPTTQPDTLKPYQVEYKA